MNQNHKTSQRAQLAEAWEKIKADPTIFQQWSKQFERANVGLASVAEGGRSILIAGDDGSEFLGERTSERDEPV